MDDYFQDELKRLQDLLEEIENNRHMPAHLTANLKQQIAKEILRLTTR